MRPISLELYGFLSYRDLTVLDLEGMGAVAIVGENGSGKSSLVEAMTWALFNRGRGRSTDDYVSSGSKDCRVVFVFELDGQRYRVERQRQLGAKDQSYLGFGTDENPVALSGHQIRDTQANIERVIGMSPDLWEATCFIGQGKADQFTQLKPSERIELFMELLGLDQYADLAETARARVLAVQRDRDACFTQLGVQQLVVDGIPQLHEARSRLEDERAELAFQQEQVAKELEEAQEEYEAGRERRRSLELWGEGLETLRAVRKESIAGSEDLARRSQADLDSAEADLRFATNALAEARQLDAVAVDAIEALPDKETELQRMDAVLRDTRDQIARAAAKVDATQQAIDSARHFLEETRERRDTLGKAETGCFTCGQLLDEDLRAQLLEQLETEEARHADALDLLTAELTEAQEIASRDESPDTAAASRARRELDGLVARIDRRPTHEAFNELRERRDLIEDRVAETKRHLADARAVAEHCAGPDAREKDLEQRIRLAKDQIAEERDAGEELARLRLRTNILVEKIETLAGQVGGVAESLAQAQAAEESISELLADRDRLETDHRAWSLVAEACSRDEIPKQKIESALPEFAAQANELLQSLTGGRFSVRIETLRAKKSGGVMESLDIVVSDDVSDRPIEQLSGGERQCVDLSLRIALARLLAHRAGRQIETLIIDEGFTALDLVHRRRTISTLHGLVQEFPSVLFVTHLQDLAEAFPSRIQVTRDARSSRLGTQELVPA